MTTDLSQGIRTSNRTLNQWEQFYRQESLASYPTHIQFPTGTRCNLKCRFCTEREGTAGEAYEYHDLDYEQFLSIVRLPGWDRALHSISTIALYGWGEPLFNRDYARIFEYLAEHYPRLGITISTNGVLFDRHWSERFIALPNADINVSVNAATRETYRWLMGSDQFERVTENLRTLTGLRREANRRAPAVTLSYVATTANIRELPLFVDLAADLGVDSVVVQDIMSLSGEAQRLSLACQPQLARQMFAAARDRAKAREMRLSFVSFETHAENYFPTTVDGGNYDNSAETGSIAAEKTVPSPFHLPTDCFDPWERFMIRVDGEVFPCCRFQDHGDCSLGNIFHQSFQEIWNGESYRTLRQGVNSTAPPPVCAICPRKAGLD